MQSASAARRAPESTRWSRLERSPFAMPFLDRFPEARPRRGHDRRHAQPAARARARRALRPRASARQGARRWPAARALPWDAWLATLWQEALAAGAVAGERAAAHAVAGGARVEPDRRREGDAAHRSARRRASSPPMRGRSCMRGAPEATAGAPGRTTARRRRLRGVRPLGEPLRARAPGRQRRSIIAELPDRLGEWATRDRRRCAACGVALCGLRRILAAAGAAHRGARAPPGPRSRARRRCRRVAGASRARERRNAARRNCAALWRGRATRALADPGAAIGDRGRGSRRAPRRDPRARRRHPVPGVAVARRRTARRARTISRSAQRSPTCRSSPPRSISSTGPIVRSPLGACGRAAALALDRRRARCVAALARSSKPSGSARAGATITMRAAIAALRRIRSADSRSDGARRIDGVRDARQAASPREHADAWRAWLAACGWPGSATARQCRIPGAPAHGTRRSPSSRRWARSSRRMSRADALAALRAHLEPSVFQPESPAAPIQIVGVLEAAGQPFDALWVAGSRRRALAAARRGRIRLLPVAWQRERNVPRSSAARELAYATALTAQFARAAPEVVFSHARNATTIIRARRRRCCPQDLQSTAATESAVASTAQRNSRCQRRANAFATTPRRRWSPAQPSARRRAAHRSAKRLPVQGGGDVSAWRAKRGPTPVDGLSALERGMLVHAALAAFWRDRRNVSDVLSRCRRDALRARDAAAAEDALKALPPSRWRVMPPLVRAGEAARIATLVSDMARRVRALAAAVHRRRRGGEAHARSRAGLHLRLRLDRIDALDGGGVAIIDYKTGRTSAPGRMVRRAAARAAAWTLCARPRAAPCRTVGPRGRVCAAEAGQARAARPCGGPRAHGRGSASGDAQGRGPRRLARRWRRAGRSCSARSAPRSSAAPRR